MCGGDCNQRNKGLIPGDWWDRLASKMLALYSTSSTYIKYQTWWKCLLVQDVRYDRHWKIPGVSWELTYSTGSRPARYVVLRNKMGNIWGTTPKTYLWPPHAHMHRHTFKKSESLL